VTALGYTASSVFFAIRQSERFAFVLAFGSIMRTERSALCSEAQPIQDVLGRIIFRRAGLTDAEAEGLGRRLSTML
jgi:hypothetical protein